MKLWAIGTFNEDDDNFQQIIYKFYPVSIEQEIKLVDKIFKLFYLNHRDAKKEIEKIEKNKNDLPYRKLYTLIFPEEDELSETEYLVALLNFFNIELEEDEENHILNDIITHE
jgi:hypothetical protein